jgi:hypothetical protein
VAALSDGPEDDRSDPGDGEQRSERVHAVLAFGWAFWCALIGGRSVSDDMSSSTPRLVRSRWRVGRVVVVGDWCAALHTSHLTSPG